MSQRKPDGEQINRNPRVYPSTNIMWDGKTRGPELPGGISSAEAKEWWAFVRVSAQAMLMQDSDWEQMKIALRLYDQMFSLKQVVTKGGDVAEIPCTPGELRALSAEWRTYTETYGFTRQSRIRYGINIVTADDIETGAVQEQMRAGLGSSSPVDYKKLLGGSR